MTDPGELESHRSDKAQGQTSTSSQKRSHQVSQDDNYLSSSPPSSSSSQEASSTLATLSSKAQRGGKYGASTYMAQQGQESQVSSTKLLDTATFTLSQARGILGSTNTMGSLLSSLTSIRTVLNARRSLGGWTDTLSKCKLKEVTSLLAGLTYASYPTTTGTSSGTQHSKGASKQGAYSSLNVSVGATQTSWRGSREQEIDLTHTSDEEDSDYGCWEDPDDGWIHDTDDDLDYVGDSDN